MKNFFKKVIDFIKEATWLQPILFVLAILILIFGIQGCGKMVNKVKNTNWGCACKKESEDPYTKILAEDVMEKIENGDDFVLYIGYETCSGCQAFAPVLERFHEDYPKKKVYYLSIQQNEETKEYKDATLTDELLKDIHAPIKNFLGGEGLATPTVAVFKDGECIGAEVGGGQNGISVTDILDLFKKLED